MKCLRDINFSINLLPLRQNARIAQLVEHNLAKVGVASSSLVSRSFESPPDIRGAFSCGVGRGRCNFGPMQGKIITDHGTLTVDFFEQDAPNTVANFVKLAKDGFYEGLKFHRVIPGFVAQGGCPNGIGNGGPGYQIDCELDGDNQFHDKGVLSMAHAGRNTGGSQFFIVHDRASTAHLDRNHTCFGKVVDGLDLIDQIKQGDTFRVEIVED